MKQLSMLAAGAITLCLGLGGFCLAQESDLYGVIEIGASGLKPLVLQAVDVSAQDRAGAAENIALEPYRIVEKVPTEEVNALNPESADKVASVTAATIKAMIETYRVPRNHIYVVGSSGLAAQKSKSLMEEKVNAAIGGAMDFITADDEAVLAFKGVINTLPSSVRELRRRQVLFLDIGSGNTRGAYLTGVQPERYSSFEIPWGTKSFAKKVDEGRPEEVSFVQRADELRKTELLTAIRRAIANSPGLGNIKRVYLAGGASFAMATLIYPDAPQSDPWVPIRATAIPDFYRKATTDRSNLFAPSLARVSAADRPKVEKSIKDIETKIFSGDQIVAAAELLTALNVSLQLSGKTTFFTRNALYAWPFGYLDQKIRAQAR